MRHSLLPKEGLDLPAADIQTNKLAKAYNYESRLITERENASSAEHSRTLRELSHRKDVQKEAGRLMDRQKSLMKAANNSSYTPKSRGYIQDVD